MQRQQGTLMMIEENACVSFVLYLLLQVIEKYYIQLSGSNLSAASILSLFTIAGNTINDGLNIQLNLFKQACFK